MPIPDLSPSHQSRQGQKAYQDYRGHRFETEGELHHLDFPRPPQPWRRMLAFFIDFSIIHACSLFLGRWTAVLMLRFLISSSTAVAMSDAEFASIYSYAILIIWPLYLLFGAYAYYLVFLNTWGTTVGKGILGLEVVGVKGKPDPYEISRRYFFSLINVATWGVTFYMMAYGPGGRCVQDRASGTYVQRRLVGAAPSRGGEAVEGEELDQDEGQDDKDDALDFTA